MKFQGNCGEIEVTQKALKKIVYYSLTELSDKLNVSAKNWLQKVLNVFSSEESNLVITDDATGVTIDLYVAVGYGINIPETFAVVKEKIVESFKKHLSVETVDVNMHVTEIK
ncbi:MAG: Asp23/Gls24 family envelope stress response protein [Fervidobacterium sp.]|uniref:Asp23/Gls24 family envelope stress response protein n=1 Tax=Fervidobacterium sp. TaxID=1871331 RepID=UPI00404A6013